MNFLNSPTLRLLNSSTVVAISGALRLHIAFLFAGIEPKIMVYLALGLIIYATYTLDRSLDCKEDAINKSELTESNKRVAIMACIIAFIVGAFILAGENVYFASFFPFIVGYLYSKGIKVGKHNLKLKGSMGGKNIVIGLTWGGTIGSIVSRWTESIFAVISIFLFYTTKLFMNSVLYDFKDIKGDAAAGIKTLPVCFGKDKIRKILLMLCSSLHVSMIIALFMGFIRRELVVMSYSFIIGSFASFWLTGFETQELGVRKYAREILIDGESAIALVLRSIINSLF